MKPTRYSATVFMFTLSVLLLSAMTSTDADEPRRVFGQVLNAKGQVVPQATVWLVYPVTPARHERISAKADDAGHFEFELAQDGDFSVTVLVWKEGVGMGYATAEQTFGREAPRRSIHLPVVIKESLPLDLQVLDPNGAPVTRGHVELCGLSSAEGGAPFALLRSELRQLRREVDEQGRVTLEYLPEDYSGTLLIETPDYGRQVGILRHTGRATARVVELLPVGTVHVSLTGDLSPNEHAYEVEVNGRPTTSTSTESSEDAERIRSIASVTTLSIDQTRQATAIAVAGNVSIRVARPPGSTSFLKTNPSVKLQPGDTTNVVLEFTQGITVRGRVLTETEEPVRGAKVQSMNNTATTDQGGYFEVVTASFSNAPYLQVVDVPAGFAFPFDRFIRVDVDEPASLQPGATIEVPPITIRKANLLSGVVVQQDNKPVQNATVAATWSQQSETGSYFTLKSEAATTDKIGRFELLHVPANSDVRMTARTPDSATTKALVQNTAEDRDDLRLEVSSKGLLHIVGRAKGADGTVISEPRVQVNQALIASDENIYGSSLIKWHGEETFRGDKSGEFISPRPVLRAGQYSITVSAPGYLATETPFLTPDDSNPELDLGQLILLKARTVTGVIHDSAGTPIANATVWSHAARESNQSPVELRSVARTDSDGRFILSQLHPRAAVAIIEAEGYRLTGFPLPDPQPEVTLTLYREDQALPEDQQVHPRSLDEGQRQQAARRLIQTIAPKVRSSRYFHYTAISMLASFDPEATVAEIGQATSPETRAKALALLDEIEDSLAEADTIEDAYDRVFTKFTLLDQFEDPVLSQEVLPQALLDAQLIRRPERRVIALARIANRFADLGQQKRAEEILKDHLDQALALSTKEWPGYARASFAEPLSRFDLETALAIVAQSDVDDQARHYLNVAHTLAAIEPASAELAFDRIETSRRSNAAVIRVAYRMAPVDLPRALGLLKKIDESRYPAGRAHGLGVVAYALNDSDPKRARQLLRQAVDTLPQPRGMGGSRDDGIFGVSMTLLRFAEEIAPDELAHYYWQTIAKYAGPDANAWSPTDNAIDDADRQAQLALLIAQYDAMPNLPSQIMQPIFAFWESQLGTTSSRFTDKEATFMAMALTNPERAVEWAIEFHEQLDKDSHRYVPQPWGVIGRTLTADRRSLGQAMTKDVFHRWVIDQYDF